MSSPRSINIIYRIALLLTVSILSACSATPDNLEPAVDILGVSDITRTGATVSFEVTRHGTGRLSFINLYYGEPGKSLECMQVSDLDSESYTLVLSGLRAGRAYECYVAGGTATATVTSRKVQFSTLPNDAPTVTPARPLSTGPVGVVVEFDITEDGGEPLVAAGCDVTGGSGETARFTVRGDDLRTGTHRLNIVGLDVNTGYTVTSFAANSIGETRGEPLAITTVNSIVLKEAGILSSLFEYGKPVELAKITISGDMDGDDFRFLRSLLGAPGAIAGSVSEVDIDGVNIVAGGGSYDGQRFTETNAVTTGLFSDCARLRSIVLPATAVTLQRDALARCGALTTLTVGAGIRQLLPSADCGSLEAIAVSPANSDYESVDGVLFNAGATEILWFPLGKGGAYTLPATVTAIGENAFYGTSISSLDIPDSVVKISRGAFAGSSLEEIKLPGNLTNVSEGLLQGCASLGVARLGAAVEFIGNYAFDGTRLKDLYVGATIPPFTSPDAFYNRSFDLADECTLHVPAGSRAMYRNHRQWGQFTNIVEF